MESKELKHWGIKGMKWGVRRYQNADGSLTPAGRARQEKIEAKQEIKELKKNPTKGMSDAELREKINRMNMEKQYSDLTKKKTSAGRKFVTGVLVSAGTAVATAYATKYMKMGVEAAINSVSKKVAG